MKEQSFVKAAVIKFLINIIMFCSKCGTKNNDDAKFCKDCGAQMGNDADTPSQAHSPVPQPPSKPPKSVLFYVLTPILVFVGIIVFWGIVNLIAESSGPSPVLEFINNVLIPFIIGIAFLALPIGIIYGIYANSKYYDGTIKCGNCDYVGPGKSGRSTWAQVTVWILFLLSPLITIIYYLVTHKYVCPKCNSTFIGLRDVNGHFSAAKSGLGPLGIVLLVFLFISIIGILAAVVLASLNDARDAGQDAATKQSLSSAYTYAENIYTVNNSYEGLCEALQDNRARVSDLATYGVYDVCNDTRTSFVITAPLNEGGYYCIDKWNDGVVVDERIYASQSACPKTSTKN